MSQCLPGVSHHLRTREQPPAKFSHRLKLTYQNTGPTPKNTSSRFDKYAHACNDIYPRLPIIGTVRLKDHVVCSRFYAVERSGKDLRLEIELRIDCINVERRLHHQEVTVESDPPKNAWDFMSPFIFSRFLGNIKEAFDKNPSLQNLLLDDFFKNAILTCQVSLSPLPPSCYFSFLYRIRGGKSLRWQQRLVYPLQLSAVH